MRVAVVGQGSIGRRHARLLLELGHDVVTFDPDASLERVPGADRVDRLAAALDGAEAAVIASPSSLHASQAREALERSVPTLVEKPLALDLPRAAELVWLARSRGVLLAVAMNLRHHPGVRAVAEMLRRGAAGRVLRASAWCGSWLPGWRAGIDYRSTYSARSALGGGALLDVAVHEIDYLLWLLGAASAVTAVARRVSNLELDVEDMAVVSVELESGAVVDVSVDYFDRAYHRGCRIVGENATVHWSWEGEEVTLAGANGEVSKQSVPSDVAPAYRSQMEGFIEAVKGYGDRIAGASEARNLLAVIDAARVSSALGRRVVLPPELELRRAEVGDARLILEWRNDPETRRWSRSTHEIGLEEHATWLERTLRDSATTIWIAEVTGEPVGQVRVTRESRDTSELHIALAPGARGKGIGAELLVEAAARTLAAPEIRRLEAYVKPGNDASRRAFARAGFISAGNDETGLERLERTSA